MARFRDAFPILEVADVERSLAFYRDAVGFQPVYFQPSEEEPAFVQLELEGGGKLGIAGPAKKVESGSVATWLYCDDVDAAFAELTEAGASAVAEPADQPWGERLASVADPDGYTIHLGASNE
jgi:lactoylglutathione lyase